MSVIVVAGRYKPILNKKKKKKTELYSLCKKSIYDILNNVNTSRINYWITIMLVI